MDQVITGSVGAGGVNRSADALKIQNLLNGVPVGWSGPMVKLKPDGIVGPKTNDAIRRFQSAQLGTIFTPDARVDPGGRTLSG
jgi:peptidoglycan hydrolase-like protein with peptidoglycan-binding domain